MAMRLLKKSEVATAKAKEKRTEIDQGLQLAKRVDSLRQTASEEEAALLSFRNKTVKQIHDEIMKATVERDALLGELLELREEKRQGMEVVTNKMWEVQKKLDEIEKLEKELNQRDFELSSKDKKLTRLEEILEGERKKIELNKQRVVNLVDKKEEELEEAKKERRQATIERANIQELVIAEGTKLLTREKDVTQREQAVLEKFTELEEIASELTNREKQINDRYQALLQAEKHVHKPVD